MLIQQTTTSNLTQTYNFASMSIGDRIVIYNRFQHARVAASEYAKRHGWCFTCRKQPNGTMHVIRVEANQASIDRRGSRGKRVIPTSVHMPTQQEFYQWLGTLTPGQSYAMESMYQPMYDAMSAWCELYSYKTGRMYNAGLWHDGTLMVTFIA